MANTKLHQAYTVLIALIIFLIPSNLFLKLSTSNAYVSGLLVDYLIPKLYISDIIIFLLLGLWAIQTQFSFHSIISFVKKNRILTAIAMVVLIRQFFTPYPYAALWLYGKYIEIFLLGWFLYNHRSLLKEKIIALTFSLTVLFQALVGMYQFYAQRSVAGYWFLGESSIQSQYGLAKFVINGAEKIEPYGTTAHPNILAGVLAMYLLLLLFTNHSQTKNTAIYSIKAISCFFGFGVLLLTASFSAWLSFVIGMIVITQQKISRALFLSIIAIILIGIPIFLASQHMSSANVSISRRLNLQTKALAMFSSSPLLGVGINQFTGVVEQYGWNREVVRFTQPVHHVGLLLLAETGLLGLSFGYFVFKKIRWERVLLPLTIIIPIASLDHYLITQQSGLLLTVLVFITLLERDSPLRLGSEMEKEME